MQKKILMGLFICSFISFTISNGLTPLLPVYTTSIGAKPAMTGYYLSLSCLMLAFGLLIGGWLADRYQRRKALLIVSGILTSPLLWLMGKTTDILLLSVVTIAAWFLIGIGGIQIWNLAGLFSNESERGKNFGIFASTGPLGAMIGGLLFGFIADKWGYSMMFSCISFLIIFWPAAGLLLEDKTVDRLHQKNNSLKKVILWKNKGYLLLLCATLIIGVAHVVAVLSRSLAMDNLGFSAAAISSTCVVAGLVGLPLPPFIGYVSDQLGRKPFLILCYLGCTLALIALALSDSLWHFWIAISLLTSGRAIANAVGSALVTDLIPDFSYGRGISMIGAMMLFSAIIGFSSTGLAVQKFGLIATLLVAAIFPFLAICFLIPIKPVLREVKNEI